jgi:hypothetical protein
MPQLLLKTVLASSQEQAIAQQTSMATAQQLLVTSWSFSVPLARLAASNQKL